MTPRGEVAMVTALIGLNMGAINKEIYSTLIMMALLTTFLAPNLLKLVLYCFKKKRVQVDKP